MREGEKGRRGEKGEKRGVKTGGREKSIFFSLRIASMSYTEFVLFELIAHKHEP